MIEKLMYLVLIGDATFFPICSWDGRIISRTGRWLSLRNGRLIETDEQRIVEMMLKSQPNHGPTPLMPNDQIKLAEFLQNQGYNLHGGVNYIYAVATEASS